MKHRQKYYLLSFLEGIGVLAVELLGAKMLAPYYGSSIFIWTTVIGITLLCLTAGYYLGSRLSFGVGLGVSAKSTRTPNSSPNQSPNSSSIPSPNPSSDTLLFRLFLIGAFFLAMMPVSTHLFFGLFSGMDLFWGCGLSTVFLLGPPLVALGATSPLLIQHITTQVADAGKVAGNVYAVSTLGGIITTFTLGFLVIPEMGISRPILFVGLMVAVVANLLLSVPKLWIRLALTLALVLPTALILMRTGAESEEISIVYEEEGILGQLKVVDTWDDEHAVKARKMLINGIPQTNVVKGDIESRSFFNYVHMISSMAAMKPTGSEVLICGLGGGSLVVEFEKLGFRVDAVDIDGRQLELAQRYFYLDAGGLEFFTDDARHFISQSQKNYDIIVLDLLVAEVQPDHLFSLEAFQVIREKLKADGLLLLNFQGYFHGPKGVAARSIFRTLQEAGFETHAVPGSEDAVGDLIFVASPTRVPFEDMDPRRLNSCCVEITKTDVFAKDPRQYVVSDPDLSDAWLLRDDRPVLDMLRLGTILEFRRNKIKSITNKELDGDMRLFK